jgi:NAD(P)H-dependent FMN reductase
MISEKVKISIVLGTGRQGRFSEKVFKFVFDEVSKDKRFEVQSVDVRDFVFGVTDDSKKSDLALKWKNVVLSSQAFLFVSPEYNRSYPGELKILIDSLFEEYKGKVAGICGVSSGGFGGVRMVENLKSLFLVLGIRPVSTDINISLVEKEFSESDIPNNASLYSKKINDTLDEIVEILN